MTWTLHTRLPIKELLIDKLQVQLVLLIQEQHSCSINEQVNSHNPSIFHSSNLIKSSLKVSKSHLEICSKLNPGSYEFVLGRALLRKKQDWICMSAVGKEIWCHSTTWWPLLELLFSVCMNVWELSQVIFPPLWVIFMAESSSRQRIVEFFNTYAFQI